MKAQKKVTVRQTQSNKWELPINPSYYDKTHELTQSEKDEIAFVVENNSTWYSKSYETLKILLDPLYNALDITGANKTTRSSVIKVIIHEAHNRKINFWAWSEEDWREIFCYSGTCFFKKYKVPKDTRNHLISIV
ncbi:MAG: hypothetical protein HWQ43_18450 [Nostoc sp. JL31]|uniref:hypothetical protein n=1 Tax=Nostoc sp. JL31 TaxID=2815395 RepID=UPI0025F4E5E3|nr:hypothetical protein [Nostoc sp. JL31]MBN3891043.1 hypothetical protein [Nostoc sp. JL31]